MLTLSTSEFLAIFGRPAEDARFIDSANAAEWLERVLYFADQQRREAA